MQEIIAEKGMGFGRISPLRTIATMEVGETWNTNTETVQLSSLRAAASRYGMLVGKRFSITTGTGIDITVTRVI